MGKTKILRKVLSLLLAVAVTVTTVITTNMQNVQAKPSTQLKISQVKDATIFVGDTGEFSLNVSGLASGETVSDYSASVGSNKAVGNLIEGSNGTFTYEGLKKGTATITYNVTTSKNKTAQGSFKVTVVSAQDIFNSYKGGLDHVDVRTAGEYDLITKVDGQQSTVTKVPVTISDVNVEIIRDGKKVDLWSYSYRYDSQELRTQFEQGFLKDLNDVIKVTGTLTGTIDGKETSAQFTKEYTGNDIVKWIMNCDGYRLGWGVGIDIDIEADEVKEIFTPYTITFIGDDGKTIDSWTQNWGTTISSSAIPAAPSIDNSTYTYTFTGWTPAGDYTLDSKVTQNMTFKATYTGTAIDYHVTYNVDGNKEEIKDTNNYSNGATITVKEKVPEKTGYRFDGWSYNGSKYTSGNQLDINGSDIEFVATWVKTYTVTFKVNGTAVNTATYDEGTNVSGKLNYAYDTPENSNFSGWTMETKDVNTNSINKDVVLTATTSTKTFTIQYYVDGKVYGDPIVVSYGDSYTVDKTYSAEGKNFSGWSTTGTISNIKKDITITGTTTVKTYTVTYLVNGDTVNTVTDVPYGSKYTDSYTYTPGEEFNFSGFTVTEGNPAKVTGNIVYSGTTSIKTFTVTFKDEKGNVIGTPQVINYGGVANKETAPAKADVKTESATDSAQWFKYYFKSWKADGSYTIDDIQNVKQNMTFKAEYTENEVKVKFYVLNKGLVQPSELSHYDATNYSTGSVGTLHYFKQIANDNTAVKNNLATVPTSFKLYNSNTALVLEEGQTIEWYVIKVESDNWHVDGIITNQKYNLTINYVDENDKTIATQYSQKVAATSKYSVTSPTVNGYTLADDDQAVIAGTMDYKDLTVTVKYTTNDYTVRFEDYNETELSETTLHYGDAIIAPQNPSRASDDVYSYEFTGWKDKTTGSTTVAESCTGDVTYVAQYTATKRVYTVTFLNDDNRVISSLKYNYNDAITVPANPTKASDVDKTYTFKAWSPAVSAQCKGDATYKATYDWAIRNYTVTFKDEKGNELNSLILGFGSTIPTDEIPTVTKAADETYTYAFDHWDAAGEYTVDSLVKSDMLFKAVMSKTYINYTVRFLMDDKTSVLLEKNDYHYLDTVILPENNPTKKSDVYNTYTFKGWDKEITAVTGNVDYIAVFDATPIEYTVTFYDEDGVKVLGTGSYYYGDDVTIPANPTKTSDNTCTYSFAGWDKEVSATCTGNAEYVAKYDSEYINYTVRFLMDDKTSVLLEKNDYHYLDTVILPENNPTKKSDVYNTYTFKGWDKEITAVTGNVDYIAVFDATPIEYTVTFYDEDGVTELGTGTYSYGDDVTIPANPTKTSDNTCTYSFAGWDKEVSATCTGNAEYVAKYDSKYIDYTVRFLMDDETSVLLEKNNYHYLDTVISPEKNPTKEADVYNTYTFKGWDKEITAVTGNVDYIAVFDAIPIEYTVTFLNDDNSVISSLQYNYNDVITVPANPTKASDVDKTYTFKAWSPAVSAQCKGNATYKATYDWAVRNYTVTFQDEDGNELNSLILGFGSTIPTDEIPTVTKEADKKFTYAFDHWEASGEYTVESLVESDMLFKAVMKETAINYTITFLDYNNDVILSKTDYHYGDSVTIPADPTREADETYTYEFTGWGEEVTATCVGNATYKATYEGTYINYTVTFLDYDNELITSKTDYHYGDTIVVPADPTREADETYTYEFTGWGEEVTATCVGNATYKATYEGTYINYTVTFLDYDNELITSKTDYHYGDTIVVPADPTREADETYTYEFAGWGEEVTATCVGNATYTAKYDRTYINYTVTFYDEDEVTVLGNGTYHYGDDVVIPANPTKASDNTYSYSFNGWGGEVSTRCTGDAEYIAGYDPVYINYTVTFLEENGTQISSASYHYGDTIIVPADRTKASTAQYDFTFLGWDSTVSPVCIGNVTYQAVFSEALRSYPVRFFDEDGETSLASLILAYGTTIPGENIPTPEKAATLENTYAFDRWIPSGDYTTTSAIAGAMDFTAQYIATPIDYTVRFLDDNGDVINMATYHYGDEIVVPADPAKAATPQYSYSFTGWDNEIVNCQGDADYTAEYASTVNVYTITYILNNTVYSTADVEYGTELVVDNSYTAPEGFRFSGWTVGTDGIEDGMVVGNVTITGSTGEVEADEDIIIPDKKGEVEADEDTTPVKKGEVEADTDTSDKNNVTTYAVLACLAGLSFAAVSRKKKKEEEA